MLAIGKSNIPLYSGIVPGDVKRVLMKMRGRVTHPFWHFVPDARAVATWAADSIPFSVSAEAIEAWQGKGLSPADVDRNILAARPRPVYSVVGRSGRPALFVGPVGALGSNDPINQSWCRSLLARPDSAAVKLVRRTLLAGGANNSIGSESYPIAEKRIDSAVPDVAWHAGPYVGTSRCALSAASSPRFPWITAASTASLYAGRAPFFSGYRMELMDGHANSLSVNHVHGLVYNAWGSTSPGGRYFKYYGGTANDVWNLFDLQRRHEVEYPGTITSGDYGFSAAGNLIFSTSPWVFREPQQVARADTSGYDISYNFWYDWKRVHSAVGADGDPGRYALNALLPVADGLTHLLTKSGVRAKALAAGSCWPMPIMSRRIGWAVGLPHEPNFFVFEASSVRADTDAGVVFNVTYASCDTNGAQLKAMYPVSTLPVEKRAEVTALLSDLPDNYPFRTVFLPDGLNYPGELKYDTTVIANAIQDGGESLDSLFFDDPDDDKPPVSYAALGAKSESSIGRSLNRMFSMGLAPEDYDFVSHSPIVFKKEDGIIVCVREGFKIDAGEAIVAMRAGALHTFEGVTDAEVAQQFFNFADWAAYMASFAAGTSSHFYRIDENICLADGTLASTADEIARAIPLVLGFDRQHFAGAVASIMCGLRIDGVALDQS